MQPSTSISNTGIQPTELPPTPESKVEEKKSVTVSNNGHTISTAPKSNSSIAKFFAKIKADLSEAFTKISNSFKATAKPVGDSQKTAQAGRPKIMHKTEEVKQQEVKKQETGPVKPEVKTESQIPQAKVESKPIEAEAKVEEVETAEAKEIKAQEKEGRILTHITKEVLSTETTFLNAAKDVIRYREAVLKDQKPQDPYLQDYVKSAKEALPVIEKFHREMKAIVEDENLSPREKAAGLGKLYQSESFKQYTNELSKMNKFMGVEYGLKGKYNSMELDEKGNIKLNNKGKPKENMNSNQIIFTQRFPRHGLFIRDLQDKFRGESEDLKAGGETVSSLGQRFNQTQGKIEIYGKVAAELLRSVDPSNKKEASSIRDGAFASVDKALKDLQDLQTTIKDPGKSSEEVKEAKAKFENLLKDLDHSLGELRNSDYPAVRGALSGPLKETYAKASDTVANYARALINERRTQGMQIRP